MPYCVIWFDQFFILEGDIVSHTYLYSEQKNKNIPKEIYCVATTFGIY